jgi:hypothetical protein
MYTPIRRILFYGLPLLIIFLAGAVPAAARPPLQESTPYIFPGDNLTPGTPLVDPYAPPTGGATFTPTPGTGITPTPSNTPPQMGSATVTQEYTPTLLPTLGRNLFGTENAEMGAARVTQPPSETPVPIPTPTPLPQPTPTAQPDASFQVRGDWFLAGILIPLAVLLPVWFFTRIKRSGEFD